MAWPLRDAIPIASLRQGEDLVALGYRTATREVAYDEMKLRYQRVQLPCTYRGTSPVGTHCRALAVTDSLGLTDFDGFSGAPVLARRAHGLVLVGMMLRATVESKAGHFLGVDVLRYATGVG